MSKKPQQPRFQSKFSEPSSVTIEGNEMKEENQTGPQTEEQVTTPVVEQPQKTPSVVDKGVQDQASAPAMDVVEHTREEKVKKAEPVTLVQEKKQAKAKSDFDIVIQEARNGTDQLNKSIAAFMDRYIAEMSPGIPVDPKLGGTNQFNLFNTINQVFQQVDYKAFKSAFVILMAFMKKHEEAAFSERYAFRFAEEWPGSSDKLIQFQATMNLLKIIGNPAERPVGKFVSLERTFNTGFTETAKENIMRYIG